MYVSDWHHDAMMHGVMYMNTMDLSLCVQWYSGSVNTILITTSNTNYY